MRHTTVLHATITLVFALIFSESSVFLSLVTLACCKQVKVHINSHILATIIQKLLTLGYTQNVTFFVGGSEEDLLNVHFQLLRGFCNNSVH